MSKDLSEDLSDLPQAPTPPLSPEEIWKAKLYGGAGVGSFAAILAGTFGHLGWGGLFFGALFGYAASRHSDAIYGALKPAIQESQRTVARIQGWQEQHRRAQEPQEASPKQEEEGRTRQLPLPADLDDEQPSPYSSAEREPAPAFAPAPGPAPIFPVYPARETLHLGKVAATGQRFDPHFNAILGKGMLYVAVQGYGKSQLCGRIIEESDRIGMPALVFDHKGEYKTIKELPGTQVVIAGRDDDLNPVDYELTAENADFLVEQMFAHRCRVIVDLPSYSIDEWLPRAEIVLAVGKALMQYAARRIRQQQKVLPCLVFLDEAQLYLPQDVNLLGAVARRNRDLVDDMDNVYLSLVSSGRSNGYTMLFATQSLTYITKWAIKSCQIQIFGRHVEKNALDAVEKMVDPQIATRATFEALHVGEAVVKGFTDKPLLVKFDKKRSRDMSETPLIDRLQEQPEEPVQAARRPAHGGIPFQRTQGAPAPHKLNWDTIIALSERVDEETLKEMIGVLLDGGEAGEEKIVPQKLSPQERAQREAESRRLPDQRADVVMSSQTRHAEGRQTTAQRQGEYARSQHFTAALTPELQNAYARFKDGMSSREFGRALGCSHTAAQRILQRLKDKGAVSIDGRKLAG